MSAHLYGHNPPPAMTANEAALLGVIDGEFRPAGHFRQLLPGLSRDSVSVALVRLRHRGLVESTRDVCAVQLWRRVPPASSEHAA